MKRFRLILCAAILCISVSACAPKAAPLDAGVIMAAVEDLSGTAPAYRTAIYGDVEDNRCFYERAVVLPNGNLLATWQRSFPLVTSWRGMKSFYFYESADLGKTWTKVSELDASEFPGLSRDKVGMCGLYVLPQDLGDFAAGTILFAVSDWDAAAEYCIHIWRSEDDGRTWTRHSDLAPRGGAKRSVWEPEFAVSGDGRLVCYYSDERQDGYDQCLAQEISTDGGLTWSDYTIIVGKGSPNWILGVSETMWRPGMPRVTRLCDGTYFMVYENIAGGHNGMAACRTSADGIHWGDPEDPGIPIMTASGEAAYQSPMLASMDDGSTYERLFVRGMNDTCSPSMCFTSVDGGKSWELTDAPLTAVRDEPTGSGWSGTFLAVDDQLIELGNCYNGAFNEIQCGYGLLCGGQLLVSGAEYKFVNQSSGLCLDGSGEPEHSLALGIDTGEDTWRIDRTSGTCFVISQEGSAYALRENSASTSESGWVFCPDGSGGYQIQSAASGLCWDAAGQSPEELRLSAPSESPAQRWQIERVYRIARLRSSNLSDCHIYHDKDGSAVIANASGPYTLTQSQWRVIPGLADGNGITLESVDMPGYFLRHDGERVVLSKGDGSEDLRQDATWIQHESLDHRGGISLEAQNMPGLYLRHRDGGLVVSEISTPLDKQDASFSMTVQ